MTSNSNPSEIGSDFHWIGIVHDGNFLPWPEPHLWTATARDTMTAIWRACSPRKDRWLHIPDYFCWDVIEYWENQGIPIRLYPDNPVRQFPDWSLLNPRAGDVVLAVNYFGVREGTQWTHWHAGYSDVILVEDHSHDPLSHWSLTSQADYAFASIRKTFPIADGAILWSPQKHALPAIQFKDDWGGSAKKLAAMILKREYLLGSEKNGDLKKVYRRLQLDGESLLATTAFTSISPWSKALIESGFPTAWRARRSQNVHHFIDLLAHISGVDSLFANWVDGEQCPYNPIILFPSETMREQVRHGFIASKIYPAIHWELGPGVSQESRHVSKCILTIPLDQRYAEEDVERCAATLAELMQHG